MVVAMMKRAMAWLDAKADARIQDIVSDWEAAGKP